MPWDPGPAGQVDMGSIRKELGSGGWGGVPGEEGSMRLGEGSGDGM